MAALRQSACDAYPEECCGVLLGSPTTAAVRAVYSLPNSAPVHARRREFRIAPEAWLAAEQEAAQRGLIVVGMYHSHPDRPALLSHQDRQSAWKNGVNVIVSCDQGIYTQVRSWRWCRMCADFVMECGGYDDVAV